MSRLQRTRCCSCETNYLLDVLIQSLETWFTEKWSREMEHVCCSLFVPKVSRLFLSRDSLGGNFYQALRATV